jgi:hypothetical protein
LRSRDYWYSGHRSTEYGGGDAATGDTQQRAATVIDGVGRLRLLF